MPVPLLDISRQHEPVREELIEAFREALASSRFIKGPVLESFEKDFAAYCGTRRAVGCASGTDALGLALQATGVERGDEVITSPFTFFATAGAIARIGAKPVFVDIDEATFNISPRAMEEWLEDSADMEGAGAFNKVSGRRITAMVPVHLFGQMCNMDELKKLSRGWQIPVVEDACQAVGATWKGEKAGSVGRAGCFSFFPSKNLGALGDGGAVTTNDEELADRVASLREHGGQGYVHRDVGTNSRLDAIQAAFLRIKLAHLEGWHEGRRRNAEYYYKALSAVPEVRTPMIEPEAESVYNQFTISVPRRDELLEHLRSKQIGCAVYYPIPLHMQQCFRHLGYTEESFPASLKASGEVVSIPVFGELTEAELDEVVSAIAGFYGAGKA
ncbi:DegT/DnrJ/EryC1/StrS family aminotransferase [Candidatus Fermentibacterales bacterium]|nr:DegT/DnrJ/EryC1/StrS family aminotransferase [Candidatus Fermentibacterales bacterium]